MRIDIDWMEILGKAAMGALYAAVADIGLTQNISKETLMYMGAVAACRFFIALVQSIKDELQRSTAGPQKKSYLSRIL